MTESQAADGPDPDGDPGRFAPPTGEPVVAVAPRRRRSVPALAIVGLCVLALIAGTWLAGGFEQARNRLTPMPVGTEVHLGPVSVTFERALARKSFTDWSVYLYATCRNNTDEPLDSVRDRWVRNGFSMRHPVTLAVVAPSSLFVGDGRTIGGTTVLNPGTPPMPCQFVFDLDEFPDTKEITVGASVLEWIDISPTGYGYLAWSAARTGYRFEVPVTIEPVVP